LTRFAFVVHPISTRDVARKYPIARFAPDWLVEQIIKRKKPVLISKIEGIKSKTGAETEGWFIGCPLTPKQMMTEPQEFVYKRIIECTELAKELGADIIGLGAFTSVVGDGGVTVAKSSPIAVTTGNSYTVATAIQGTLKACEMLDIDTSRATLAVVGATGSIGKTCAVVLGRRFAKTYVIGRDMAKTRAIADTVENGIASTDINVIREADAIVTVTSSDVEVIQPEHLKPGCVVCDVARPRDVSARVGKERPDVLVIEGGVISVPGDVNFNFSFGFPAKTAYACMSETMMLALEGRAENYTLGKDVSVEQVEETIRLAAKHGFELADFRAFEKAVEPEAVARAKAARKQPIAV
jgi:fatty aldehyde-generating acyl-ACP reductase